MAIEKLLISELKDRIRKRSMLIQVPQLFDLFGINNYMSSDEVLAINIENALEQFEYYNPLIRHFNVNALFGTDGKYTFINNFQGYINGLVPENQIELIPNSIIGFTKGPNYVANSYVRDFNYDRPDLSNYGVASGQYLVKGIYNRPYDITLDSSKNIVDTSAIYFMASSNTTDTLRFTDQCLKTIIDYILQMKKNMEMPNMPVSLFNGVEDAYAKLDALVTQYNMQ